MPIFIPAAVWYVGTAAFTAVGYFKDEIKNELGKQIGKAAAQSALNARGIPLDLDGPVNHQTITAAINAGVLGDSGLSFTNFFDKDAVKSDLARMAIEKAGEAYGFVGGLGLESILEKILESVLEEVLKQIVDGVGDYIDAAKDLPAAKKAIDRPKYENWNTPVDLSAAGVSNRSRQAKYRANHAKQWVEK